MKLFLKKLIDKLPYISSLNKELIVYKTKYKPGHFYSPIPSIEEVLQNENKLFSVKDKEIAGVNLNESEQLALIKLLLQYYNQIPFYDDKKEGLRYYFSNRNYLYSDAIFLYSIIRHFKPGKIIEIGSGFSSALMLDVNDQFFDGEIKLSFIEPYTELLLSLLDENDQKRCIIINKKLQDVDIEVFSQLEKNDILFIDSTHVSKIGSDVNYIFFEILPVLQPGVLIHVHDIFYPFEYPKQWILKGRAWNENYILRAFLQYNSQFKIVVFNSFLEMFYEDWFKENMPLCLKKRKNTVTGSLWLQKLP